MRDADDAPGHPAPWPATPASDAPVAIGWATVELDRAVVELGPRLPAGAAFAPADPSLVLGARCRVATATRPGEPRLVLLEPSTEGRLAAGLARHGEGWAASWYATTDAPAAASAGSPVDPASWRPGPLGPEALREGGPAAGPHRLWLVAATIRP